MAGTELIVVASVTHLDASKNARVTVELTGEDTDQRFLHADARLWGDHQCVHQFLESFNLVIVF
jgi:hypothetical protein